LKGEPQVLGLVGDPGLNRDSGGSTRFGDRVLWTYRDTQLCEPTGKVQTLPIITSTASWSDLDTLQPCHGDPLSTNVLHQYGHNRTDEAFFPNLPHICQSPAGNLTSGERVALWPDTPPLVTHEAPDGSDIVAYSWIRRSHIGTGTDLTVKTPNPATILYKTHHHSSRWRPADSHHALPSVSVVADSFWNQGEIPFGAYGNLRHPSDGHVYLYGQTDEDGQPRVVSLARVPCEKVEDRAAYEYFVGGEWTREMPRMYQDGIALDKCGVGGQGTFFWNPHWRKFCWIGGDCFPGAETYLCMAPRPEGPWTDGWRFYTGEFRTRSSSCCFGRLMLMVSDQDLVANTSSGRTPSRRTRRCARTLRRMKCTSRTRSVMRSATLRRWSVSNSSEMRGWRNGLLQMRIAKRSGSRADLFQTKTSVEPHTSDLKSKLVSLTYLPSSCRRALSQTKH
jgi:hypothetical protein